MQLIMSDNKYYMDEGFYVIGAQEKFDYEAHSHDFAELAYVYSGKCTHCVDGKEYTASSGDLIFINYNSAHSIRSDGGFMGADILIKPEYIDVSLDQSNNAFSLLKLEEYQSFENMIDKSNCFVNFSGKERKRLEMLIELAAQEFEQNQPGNSIMLKSCINMILTMVFRKMALPMRSDMGLGDELLTHIRMNCAMDISMERYAEKCGYNSAYFSRLFKQVNGVTFTEYVTQCRLEKACRLLKETELSVETVMEECGFGDRTRFFRLFADRFQMTPLKYRKSKKQI